MEKNTQKKILIIEDDDFLRSLAVTKLEKSGFTVVMASDGKSGLDMTVSESPNLVILDLMLPVMTGFDVLRALRNEPSTKSMQVLVFSNLGDEKDMKTCMEMGVSDYMVKSNFTLDELVEKVTGIVK